MRNWFPILVVVSLGLFLFGEIVFYMMRAPEIGVAMDNDAGAPAQAQSAHSTAKRRLGPAKKAASLEANWDGALSVPMPPLKVFPPPLSLPASPDQIKAGMGKTQLHEEFGDPALRVATTDQSQLQEVYVFPGKDSEEVTVTQMKDGVVTSAYARKH